MRPRSKLEARLGSRGTRMSRKLTSVDELRSRVRSIACDWRLVEARKLAGA